MGHRAGSGQSGHCLNFDAFECLYKNFTLIQGPNLTKVGGKPQSSTVLCRGHSFACARERQEFMWGPSEAQREKRWLCCSVYSHVAHLNLYCSCGTKVRFACRAVTNRSSHLRRTCCHEETHRVPVQRRHDHVTSSVPRRELCWWPGRRSRPGLSPSFQRASRSARLSPLVSQALWQNIR